MSVFRFVGKLAGFAIKSNIVDKAIDTGTRFALSELKLTDLRVKLALLKRKRSRHLHLLGKTIYRLSSSSIDPVQSASAETIIRVLGDIDREIDTVQTELLSRKQANRTKDSGENRTS